MSNNMVNVTTQECLRMDLAISSVVLILTIFVERFYTNSAEAKAAKHGPMKETASWVYIFHPRFYMTNKNPRHTYQHYMVGIRIHIHA